MFQQQRHYDADAYNRWKKKKKKKKEKNDDNNDSKNLPVHELQIGCVDFALFRHDAFPHHTQAHHVHSPVLQLLHILGGEAGDFIALDVKLAAAICGQRVQHSILVRRSCHRSFSRAKQRTSNYSAWSQCTYNIYFFSIVAV